MSSFHFHRLRTLCKSVVEKGFPVRREEEICSIPEKEKEANAYVTFKGISMLFQTVMQRYSVFKVRDRIAFSIGFT